MIESSISDYFKNHHIVPRYFCVSLVISEPDRLPREFSGHSMDHVIDALQHDVHVSLPCFPNYSDTVYDKYGYDEFVVTLSRPIPRSPIRGLICIMSKSKNISFRIHVDWFVRAQKPLSSNELIELSTSIGASGTIFNAEVSYEDMMIVRKTFPSPFQIDGWS